jgi:hypothetical protein
MKAVYSGKWQKGGNMKEIKIIDICSTEWKTSVEARFPYSSWKTSEDELTRLVNEGWNIVAAIGSGPTYICTVILQREK